MGRAFGLTRFLAAERRELRFAAARFFGAFRATRAFVFRFRGVARRVTFRLRAAPLFFFRRRAVAMAPPYSARRARRNHPTLRAPPGSRYRGRLAGGVLHRPHRGR
jgi:hypothetical protein